MHTKILDVQIKVNVERGIKKIAIINNFIAIFSYYIAEDRYYYVIFSYYIVIYRYSIAKFSYSCVNFRNQYIRYLIFDASILTINGF